MTDLEDEAVISGSFVFGFVLAAVVHVHIVKLQEAHHISRRLKKESWLNDEI